LSALRQSSLAFPASLYSHWDSRIDTSPEATKEGEIESVLPRCFKIILLQPLVQSSSNCFRCTAGEDCAIPGTLTLRAAIDQPHINLSLVGVQAKLVARGKLANSATSAAMPPDLWSLKWENLPTDFCKANIARCIHSYRPFQEALRSSASDE
jgi:hypothetical protein